jgi:hypothetical protein
LATQMAEIMAKTVEVAAVLVARLGEMLEQ